ncbi:MAG: glycine C-acetyltransferase [Thermoproteota archaeon]|jgi:glycine C-acetyltransferase
MNDTSEDEFGENAENFNAHDFLNMDIQDLKERVRLFSSNFNTIVKTGFVFRKVHGVVSKKTKVENSVTKEINELYMLGSNNYLDLAVEPSVIKRTKNAIDQFGVGCGGPAALNGYSSIHRELELKLAKSRGTEDCIIFTSGYSANIAWPPALLQENDYLIYDNQSHGSLFDAIKLGNFKAQSFPHNDLVYLEKRLRRIKEKSSKANVIVSVEGVYSMDGDLAPLKEIQALCKQYNCMLNIDDAHGSGVMGNLGKGTQEHFGLTNKIDIILGTFSKTYTSTGGFIAASKDIVDYLRVFGHSYIFSASLAPSVVGTVLGCLEFIEQHPERVANLHKNVDYFVSGLNELGFSAQSDSAIIPIFIDPSISLRKLVAAFHEEGIFVNGIEYPSVPKTRQRLRISMMATFTQDELNEILEVFKKLGTQFGLIK